MRRRVWNLVVISLVLGIVGAISVSLIAGSRRSSSVVRRYFAATIPYDLLLYAPTLTGAQVSALPGVVRADYDGYIALTRLHSDGSLGDPINGVSYSVAAIDPTFRVLEGRIPRVSDTSSVMVNESFAKQLGLGAGDPVTVRALAKSDADAVNVGKYAAHGPVYRFRISAVVRSPLDIALDEEHSTRSVASTSATAMYVPDKWYEAHRNEFLDYGPAYDVQLGASTTKPSFVGAAQAASGKGAEDVGVDPPRFSERRGSLETPVGLETDVLLALGVGTALAGLIVVGLLLRAEQRVHEPDGAVLRALGATRTRLGLSAVMRTAPAVGVGAALATGAAVFLSSRYPVGVGRQLELTGGIDANAAVLAVSVAVIIGVVTVLVFVLERYARERRARTRRRGSIAARLAGWGAPPEAVVGAHFAFGRGGAGNTTSSRPVIAGGGVALALIAAIGVFVAGTNELYGRSVAHGWPWDAVIGNQNFDMSKARETKLVADRRVAAATRARYGQATVGNVSTEVLAIDPAGSAPPAIVSGRLPRAADEIAPGARLLHALHAQVGGQVRLSVSESEFAVRGRKTTDRNLTVVGVSLSPILGESDLGAGAVVTTSAIRSAGGTTEPQFVLVRLRGSDRLKIAASLARDYTPDVLTDVVPSRIVNLHRVRTLPVLGALLAAALGTTLLAYTLAVGVRARNRQLGVLRALGMTNRRVGRVLTWQGVSLALAIAAIGLPIGVFLGALVWRPIANGLGVSSTPTINFGLLLLVPAVIAVGVAVAVLPARRARRADVAALFRVE